MTRLCDRFVRNIQYSAISINHFSYCYSCVASVPYILARVSLCLIGGAEPVALPKGKRTTAERKYDANDD